MKEEYRARFVPQALLAVTAASVFLPWRQTVDQETLRGVELGEGPLVLIAAAFSIALVQVGLRPAWMGPGFIVAVLGRQVLTGVAPDSLQYGVVITLVLAVAAAGLLVSTMLSNLGRPVADVNG